MRVLALAWALSDHVYGGEPIGAYELVRHLALEGADVDVVTPTSRLRAPLPSGVQVHEVGADRVGNSGRNKWRMLRAARALAARTSYDVVHVVTQFTSLPVFARPFVMSGCWNEPEIVPTPRDTTRPPRPPLASKLGDLAYAVIEERLRGWRLDRTIREADAIILRESRGASDYASRARRVAFIPFGVDPDYFHGAPARDKVILYAGNLKPYKGVDVLIDAFARLARDDTRSRLRIAGDGPERPALEARARARGVEARVEFLGHVPRPELVREHASASVFALPSYRESFGQVALEAMASSTPVVLTSGIAGAFDYLEDGKNGYRVPPGDAGALADRLARVLIDPAHARALGAEARKTAERFSWRRVAREHLALYAEISGRPLSPTRPSTRTAGRKPRSA